jgi:pimeloyl-ACP methyl ester carboxylesterase
MRKFFWPALLAVAVALIIVGPVLFATLRKSPGRKLAGVRLAETHYRDVTFKNARAGLKLGGMLFIPEGIGPFSAAVIIQGSGTSQRDNRWYLTLTDYLQKQGIAVLLPDKRGSANSDGDWRTASFDDLATDTIAAMSFLENQNDFPISKLGVIGLSQGGHIAPIVASKSNDVAFVVDIVGSSLPMYDVLAYEETHNLREMGFLPGISDLVSRVSALYLRKIVQRNFWNAVGDFDPLPYWKTLTVPALVLYGAEDTNVPSKASADRLNSLHKPNIKVIVFEGSGHALASPEGLGDRLFRDDALRQIVDFIHSATGSD